MIFPPTVGAKSGCGRTNVIMQTVRDFQKQFDQGRGEAAYVELRYAVEAYLRVELAETKAEGLNAGAVYRRGQQPSALVADPDNPWIEINSI